jgi:hypothetical protein
VLQIPPVNGLPARYDEGVGRFLPFAVAACALACGGRTGLGVVTLGDGGTKDAATDVAPDVVPDAPPPTSCPPIDLVVDDNGSTAIAIDDTFLYFVVPPGNIERIAKDGAGPIVGIGGPDGFGGDVAVDDTYVYFTSAAGHLERVSKAIVPPIDDLGCAALAGCPGNVHVRAVAKDVVVLVDGFQPVAFPKSGGSPYPLAPANIAPPAPVHYVFTDDARAYWNTDIRVFSAPLDGSGTVLQYATSSSGLAIDSTHVYWTAIAGANAWAAERADKDGSATTTLSTSDTSTPLVASDAFLYGVSPGGITRQSTSGGAPIVIVPDVHPLTLLLDQQCLFFAEKTVSGRRIARAPN